MREEDIPINKRYLILTGILSPLSLNLDKPGLLKPISENNLICWVMFAYADIPIPKKYTCLFELANPKNSTEEECFIVDVTQQWSKPFDSIPQGWKTICNIQFPNRISKNFQQLEITDDWYDSKNAFGLCEKECFLEIKRDLKIKEI